VVTANKKGQVKGYISNPLADRPLNEIGKLDVKGIVDGGFLRVIKDLGMKAIRLQKRKWLIPSHSLM
jgi:molecular chaperone Hsp33